MRLYNLEWQKERRRTLRTDGTRAEAVLWKRLRGRQLGGLKWRRQYGVGPYIVDFYCPAVRLAIELDGEVHEEPVRRAADAARTAQLERAGIRVLRFSNHDVLYHPALVLESILHEATA